MSNIFKKPYEISLWEDILVFVVSNEGTITEYEETLEGAVGTVIAQYYKERKICVIGSDTMDTPIRATQSKLVKNINGSTTLTFNLLSRYYDEDAEEFYDNPYVDLLVNERKVKVRYGALDDPELKWYDLIIKNTQENSDNKTFSYTARDLFVNELSKSGFNLQLDTELENNMGNITSLAETILDESDWKLKAGSDILEQVKEEPLYHLILNQQIRAKDMKTSEEIDISAGSVIYAFYSNIVNQESFLQFLYADKYETDDDYVITNSPNWCIDNITYNNNGLPAVAASMTISDKYRGKRLVRKVATKYDATIDKYVNIYKDGDTEVYGYTETEYLSPATVRSFITNANSYDSYTGWEVGGIISDDTVVFPELQVVSVPDVRDVSYENINNGTVDFTSCLKLKIDKKDQILYNSGIVDYRHHINGFIKDEKYVFRVKYGAGVQKENEHGASSLVSSALDLKITVGEYTLKDGVYAIDKVYFEGQINSNTTATEPEYKHIIVKCKESLPYNEMVKMGNSLGLFIQPLNTGTCYIEDVQFFSYIDNNGQPLLPDEIKTGDVKTIYYYYIPNKDYTSIEDVQYVYKGDIPASFAEVYNDNTYEKVRSITASESNRFNLIQELCEIFECWPKFEIEHNSQTGEILLDENYRQKKWISFHEYVGTENDRGFKYGINLKSIKRTIDSDSITSKIIVKNNSNEFATDGFCSIARASESPNGENFILDFSYYIQQGMLGMSEITNDLYLESNGYIGYYKKLKRINEKRDQYIQEQSGLLTDISEYQAAYQTYSLSVNEAEEQLKDKYIFIKTLTGYSFEEMMSDQSNDWWENDQVIQTVTSIGRLKSIIKNHGTLAKNAEDNLNLAQERYDWLTRALSSKESTNDETEERLLLEKEELNRKFYKKYSRFLQEGSWISEDYIDDNLYYLDAESTLHTSSQPKITYAIEVLEISQLEEYENYTFALGDKTYMEDTEFFGWTFKDGVQTPYREEIVVTELIVVLDSPEQNQIKVQNYKTQFEDLFQRMAATTQSVEYSTGQYNKVSGIVKEDGTIDIVTLQNSISNNALILQNAKDQSVVWDETGITTTSLKNPSEVVRIVSGGIFLSKDGGITWNTGVTGKGINASQITSGQINTEEINIINGAFPSFRWDTKGISAYEFQLNQQTGAVTNFNYSKFVRIDQYGIYGINGYSNFDSAAIDDDGISGEDKIWKYANFALTWKGFQLKSSHVDGGHISITSDEDFQVRNSSGKELVKIGRLGNFEGAPYGLRIKDEEGHIVLEQTTQGKVWIKNEIKIGDLQSSVGIGYLDKTRNDGVHEVINANDKFIVYEDGAMKATNGEFTGIIHATGGTIGGLEISSFTGDFYQVTITSDNGPYFKNGKGTKILTAQLYKGSQPIDENVTYQWYRFNEKVFGATSKTIEVSAENLNEATDSATYSCEVTYEE